MLRAMRRPWAALLAVVVMLAAPAGLASAQEGVSEWNAAYAAFAAKGQEIVDDFTVLFDPAWVAEWEADVDAMVAAAQAMAAAGIIDIAADVAAAAENARQGAENLVADQGTQLTAAYETFGELNAQVEEATAGMAVAPAPTGSAGLLDGSGGAPSALILVMAAFTALLLAAGRLATARRTV